MKSLLLLDEISDFVRWNRYFCAIKANVLSSFSVRRPIGRRTQSNRVANAIWSDGGRNPIGRRSEPTA